MAKAHIDYLNSADVEFPLVLKNNSNFISELCDLIDSNKLIDANQRINTMIDISPEDRLAIKKIISKNFLWGMQKEWTSHGIWKTFRFYTDEEKISYLNRSNNIIKLLESIVPHVTFGFGSVLGFVRDNNFIPYDDDMDLIVALDYSQFTCYEDAKSFLMGFLVDNSISVYNVNTTHFTADGVDVFIGFYENYDQISWYPSEYNAGLTLNDLYPPTILEILGIHVKIPRNFYKYLQVTYGENWNKPDSSWKHPWNIGSYTKFLRLG